MRTTLRLQWVILLILLAAKTAQAEPFTILPNGDLVFNVSVSTTGVFTCGSAVRCTGSGTDSITLHSGSGTATFTFTGASASDAVGNVLVPMTLGTIEGSTTAGFLLEPLNVNTQLFRLAFTLAQSSPALGAGLLRWSFGPAFSRIGEEAQTYLVMPTGPQPPQFHYTSIIYTMRVTGFTLPPNGSRDIVADVGAVPEPTSLLLIGTGLVGAICSRRHREVARVIPGADCTRSHAERAEEADLAQKSPIRSFAPGARRLRCSSTRCEAISGDVRARS